MALCIRGSEPAAGWSRRGSVAGMGVRVAAAVCSRRCAMSDTILLWGVSGDPPLMALLAELEARAVPHHFLDQRRMHQAHFDFAADGVTGTLSMAERDIELAAIGALYARPNDLCAVMRRSTRARRRPRHSALDARDRAPALRLGRDDAGTGREPSFRCVCQRFQALPAGADPRRRIHRTADAGHDLAASGTRVRGTAWPGGLQIRRPYLAAS